MMETVYRLPILKLNKKEPPIYYCFKDPVKLFDFMCAAFTNDLNEKPRTIFMRSSLDDINTRWWVGVKFKKPESFNFIKKTDNIYLFNIMVGIERVTGKKYTQGLIKEEDIDPNTKILSDYSVDLDDTHTIYRYRNAKLVQHKDGSVLPEQIFDLWLYPEVIKKEGYPIEKICFQFECEMINIYLDL
jgi:hypothetical protein